MKKTVVLLFLATTTANAAAPATSCPTGYISIVEDAMIITDSTCPTGYTSAGTASSCLVTSPSGSCIMYAPTGMTFTDSTGSYEFTSACPML